MLNSQTMIGDLPKTAASRSAPRVDRPASADGFDPMRLFRLIRRQLPIFGLVVLMVNGLALLIALQLAPIYRSSALLIVEPHPMSFLDNDPPQAPRPADGARVESEVEILRSPAMLLKVVDALDLTQDPELGFRPSWRHRIEALLGIAVPVISAEEMVKQTLDRLRRTVAINRRGTTQVISVDGRSRDPARAAQLANALAKASIDAQTSAKIALAADVEQRLARQLDNARAALRGADGRLDTFLDDSIRQIRDPDLRAELLELRDGIKATTDTSQRFAALADRARDRIKAGDWDALIAELNSDRLVALNRSRIDTSAELAAATRPADMRDLRARLVEINRQMDQEAASVVNRVAAEADNAGAREGELRQRLSRRLADRDIPSDLVLRFREVEGEVNALSGVVDRLTTSAKWAAAQMDLQLPDSRIAAPALPPAAPISPDKPMLLSIAAVLSFILAVVAALVRDRHFGGLASREQVESTTGLAVIGDIPNIERRGAAAGHDPQLTAAQIVDHPTSAFSAAINTVRLELEMAALEPDRQDMTPVILVTSTLPGEGKTLIALSLARALSLAGRRTLLIEGGRHAALYEAAGLETRQALAVQLAAQSDATAVEGVIRDRTANLDLIVRIPGGRSVADIVQHASKIRQTLPAWRRAYDAIIIDGTALSGGAETRFLIGHADDIVFVVAASQTGQRKIRDALADILRFRRADATCRTIINRASPI
ncbi:hypothetical protein OSH11_23425 [Kaistia dalseonensis]|uniref:Uncharacterized protein involved in exopolysaccharide biosynthesis/Mrp family chromosome partitioning ATPase n=1 Tax=Kaistia dalseonensis TaxID=410840 RepID=A0ABU0HDB3_9HYPH|nr:Wzz/FepE/Etk N-terminal domain-containing protein [Kaistia dalseonensis]MCX5497669.1 hypothetical protein [Kaistia dalseonensis]MDQ0440313.1 uncharacterized protein involved in exopolysaccharide biosynthesis/Mrp family chromosome partitioning ATPase [Kaistia dalseonensis]